MENKISILEHKMAILAIRGHFDEVEGHVDLRTRVFVSVVNFKPILHLFLVHLFLTLNRYLFAGRFKSNQAGKDISKFKELLYLTESVLGLSSIFLSLNNTYIVACH